MTKHTVTLGEKTFEIDAPLTFKQLRIVEPAFARILSLSDSGITEESYDKMADVILACVMKNNPEFTRSVLDETPIPSGDLKAAFNMIGIASGLLKPAEEPAQGEAEAESQNP